MIGVICAQVGQESVQPRTDRSFDRHNVTIDCNPCREFAVFKHGQKVINPITQDSCLKLTARALFASKDRVTICARVIIFGFFFINRRVVPSYQRGIGEQDPAVVRRPMNATPDAYGAGVGKALEGAGEAAHQVAMKEKQKDDLAAVIDATNGMTSEMLNFFSGPDGLLSRQGVNAQGITQQGEKFMREVAGKYRQKLSPDQRAAFDSHMKLNSLNYLRDVATHERHQKNAVNQDASRAGLELSMKGAAANYDSPKAFFGFLTKGEQILKAHAVEYGLPPEKATLARSNFITGSFIGAVQQARDDGYLDKAFNLLEIGKNAGMDQAEYTKLKKTLTQTQHANEDNLAAENIVKQAMRPDGTVDQAQLSQLRAEYVSKWKPVSMTPEQAEMIRTHVTGATQNVSGLLLSRVAQLAKDKGMKLEIGDGYRTKEEQAVLWEQSDKSGKMVAAPGSSRHEAGFAIDAEWAKSMSDAELAKYGLYRPMDYEPWHVEPIETKGKSTADLMAGGPTDTGREKRFDALVHAKAADTARIRTDYIRNYKNEFAAKLLQAPDLETATRMIDYADNEIYSPQQKESLLKQAQNRYNPKSQQTPGRRFWFEYEKSGLSTDLKTTYEYEQKLARGEVDIEEDDGKRAYAKYQKAQDRMRAYWNVAYGRVDPDQAFSGAAGTDARTRAEWEKQKSEIRQKHPDATDSEIEQFLTWKQGR